MVGRRFDRSTNQLRSRSSWTPVEPMRICHFEGITSDCTTVRQLATPWPRQRRLRWPSIIMGDWQQLTVMTRRQRPRRVCARPIAPITTFITFVWRLNCWYLARIALFIISRIQSIIGSWTLHLASWFFEEMPFNYCSCFIVSLYFAVDVHRRTDLAWPVHYSNDSDRREAIEQDVTPAVLINCSNQ